MAQKGSSVGLRGGTNRPEPDTITAKHLEGIPPNLKTLAGIAHDDGAMTMHGDEVVGGYVLNDNVSRRIANGLAFAVRDEDKKAQKQRSAFVSSGRLFSITSFYAREGGRHSGTIAELLLVNLLDWSFVVCGKISAEDWQQL